MKVEFDWQKQPTSQSKQWQTHSHNSTKGTASQPGPKLGSPALKQPQFNWEAADKYTEWKAFILEVRNILSTCNAQEQDKIAIVKTG